jgi:hypothetical protein
MKRLSGIFLALFILQSLVANASRDIYSIQLGVFAEPQPELFQELTSVGMIYIENITGSNLKKVMMSKFEDRGTADIFLQNVKARGFEDAFITRRTVDDTKIVKTIQLASYTVGKSIDLSNTKALGNVYLHIKENEIRVLTGFYIDITSAKIALDKARNNGFPSAFMKDTDIIWLEPLTAFEERYLMLGDAMSRASVSTYDEYAVPTLNTKSNIIYEKGVTNAKAKTSIAGLQEALKDGKKFDGNIDGVYDEQTQSSLTAFQENNEVYQQYASRSIDKPEIMRTKGDIQTLQGNIDLIEINPAVAAANLRKFDHPVAKFYLAYLHFTDKVPTASGREVDFLMNDAIKQAYENYNGRPRFDYSKEHTYPNYQKLFQHFALICYVSDNNPKIPCWMVKEHNYELSEAFAGLTPPEFTDCEGFDSYKDVRILKAMARDLDHLPVSERLEKNESERQSYKARCTELYLNPKKVSLPEQELYEMWNVNLIDAIEQNISKDPLKKEILTAFKVTYFSVYNQLESHYSTKMKFDEDQSKALALATLYALVNYNLGDYITR